MEQSEQFIYETVSSTLAFVGFLVGYSVAFPKDTSEFCPSRQTQAELSVDWNRLPLLCRADSVVARNRQLEGACRNDRSKAARPKATAPVEVDYDA